jgi:hypothetical protein
MMENRVFPKAPAVSLADIRGAILLAGALAEEAPVATARCRQPCHQTDRADVPHDVWIASSSDCAMLNPVIVAAKLPKSPSLCRPASHTIQF